MSVERQIPEDERGHDGLTSAERIKQMTQPVPVQGDLDSYWYNHQIAIVNKRNKELERRIADLAAEVERKDAEIKRLERALDNTVETLNDLADSTSSSRRYYRSYFAVEQLKVAAQQIKERICNHGIRLPHECKDCLDILSDELSRTDQQLQPKGEQG